MLKFPTDNNYLYLYVFLGTINYIVSRLFNSGKMITVNHHQHLPKTFVFTTKNKWIEFIRGNFNFSKTK